ncbi:MAG: class I SAM-dependent methyltransferase [Candidatus Acidiferrales bacterium]
MSSPTTSPASAGSGKAIDAAALMQIQFSFAASRILLTALELDVFSPLASAARTAPEMIDATGYSARGLPMLLDALVPLGLLEKRDDRYELTPISENYLVNGKPDYIGRALVEAHTRLLASWDQLADSIRTGKPYSVVEEQKAAEEFFPALVRWLHVTNADPARRLAQALRPKTAKNPVVLDVACGSGIWGISFAQAEPTAQVIANDYPKVLETVTRGYVEREGLSARYRYAPGDVKQLQLPIESCDLILLGNIIHSEGEAASRAIFRKCFELLKPGGQVAIIDMIPNDQRTGPPFALIFALNMLVNTATGSTYTMEQYRSWLGEAGFNEVATVDVASHSPAIVARKS